MRAALLALAVLLAACDKSGQPTYDCYTFHPTPDMTAEQLARVMMNIHGYGGLGEKVHFRKGSFETMPADLKRFWQSEEECK